MPNTAAEAAHRFRELLAPIRPTVDEIVFAVEPAPLGTVTGLLSAVPSELCEQIGGLWADTSRFVPENELRAQFNHEDRMLLDLVLSLSDDRRTYATGVADRAP